VNIQSVNFTQVINPRFTRGDKSCFSPLVISRSFFPATNHENTSITELNSIEVSAVSGGIGANDIGAIVGGVTGAIGAVLVLVSNPKFFDDNYCNNLSMVGKITAAFGLSNLKMAAGIFLRVSACSILFSGVGFLIEYIFGLNEKNFKLEVL